MEDFKDIQDDEIRIIGSPQQVDSSPASPQPRPRNYRTLSIALIIVLLIAVVASVFFVSAPGSTDNEPSLFEPIEESEPETPLKWLGMNTDSISCSFTQTIDTTINDIPLRILIPHNAEMKLHIGSLPLSDSSIVYIAQAADVRADNGGIVGAFVLGGNPLAWGLSKTGYCASINGKITVGVAQNSPLFEEATGNDNGYFFRQYPLVSNGKVVENEVKGKSIRRGICQRQGETFIAETLTRESFHDFSQALVDLGVNQAIYLVGSVSFGWYTDIDGTRHTFGTQTPTPKRYLKNINYITWCKK